MLLSLLRPEWSLQWTSAASNSHWPKRFSTLLTFGRVGAGSGRGSELVWFGLERGDVDDGWCDTLVCPVCGAESKLRSQHKRELTSEWNRIMTKKVKMQGRVSVFHAHTVEALLVVLATAVGRCLRLWGGVVLVVVVGVGILSRLTGVGGALSDRGREIPVRQIK